MNLQPQFVHFNSQNLQLTASLYLPATSTLHNTKKQLPCIVMAHGLGGTVAAGLAPFAQHFAAAGFAVFCFDYRGFGLSVGEPRQMVSVKAQLQDWQAAIDTVRLHPEIDPSRVALWGSSFSGGLVISAAVQDGKIAAVSSQGAMMDGLAALQNLIKRNRIRHMAKITACALLDAAYARMGHARYTLPVVGDPGEMAVLTSPDSKAGYLRIAPPDWTNAITLDWMLSLARYRPNLAAAKLPCPTLFCIATQDVVVPPSAVEDAARRAGSKAVVKRYAAGHFDIYVPPVFNEVIADQTAFFLHTLA